MQKKTGKRSVLLVVLDGWGYREETDHNAIHAARTPVWDELWATAPHTLLSCHGDAVGLPPGQSGNSEVGHLCLGGGRTVLQSMSRINAALEDGSFYRNPAYCAAVDGARERRAAVHILGLLSPGGVHSHTEHLCAAVRLAAQRGATRLYVHAFLDGRDTPPRSASQDLDAMERCLRDSGAGRIASLVGRYYAMDRDQRWERTQSAYRLIAEGHAPQRAASAQEALRAAYERGESDEFVQPTVIAAAGEEALGIAPEDAVLFLNFRADRARQLSRALVDPSCQVFPRSQVLAAEHFASTTEYARELPGRVAFAPQHVNDGLGEVLAEQGRTQLRLAETEKYAHVTFFFNGGHEKPWRGEDRQLIPSPKVATYDLQPEMSAAALSDALEKAIAGGRYDFILCNYANGDMVGHTGKFPAAVQAVEVLDSSLGRVLKTLRAAGGEMLITADHGNVEEVWDVENSQPHTSHTPAPVPLVYAGARQLRLRTGGGLRDVAPTLLGLLGITPPAAMSGHSLLEDAAPAAPAPALRRKRSASA